MSYRSILFASRKISRTESNRFRKFQKSKLPVKVSTPAKKVTKLVEVEVVEER